MVKNPGILEKFERDLIRREKPNFYKNLEIVEELHKQALQLGVFKKVTLSNELKQSLT